MTDRMAAKPARPKRTKASSSSSVDFAPPLWGIRPPAPLVLAKTGDAKLDAALAAFAAEPKKLALYRKVWKLLTAEHAATLFTGSVLDLGFCYEPTVAELAQLDASARRARHRAVLDFADQTPRGHLVVRLLQLLLASPAGRARLRALALDPSHTPRLRAACGLTLARGVPEPIALADIATLGRELVELGWAGASPTQPDDAFALGVAISLRTAPVASAPSLAAILAAPRLARGVAVSVLRGLRDALADYSNLLAGETEDPPRASLAPLVAPLRAIADDPEYVDDVALAYVLGP